MRQHRSRALTGAVESSEDGQAKTRIVHLTKGGESRVGSSRGAVPAPRSRIPQRGRQVRVLLPAPRNRVAFGSHRPIITDRPRASRHRPDDRSDSAQTPAKNAGRARGFLRGRCPSGQALAHQLKLAGPPGLVEEGLQRAVEPQDDEPASLGVGLDPVARGDAVGPGGRAVDDGGAVGFGLRGG